jgi:hypothetical protein
MGVCPENKCMMKGNTKPSPSKWGFKSNNSKELI